MNFLHKLICEGRGALFLCFAGVILAVIPKNGFAIEYKIYGKAVCKIEQNGNQLSFKSIDISNYENEQSSILPSDRGDIEFLLKHSPHKNGEPGLSFTSLKIDDFQYRLLLPVSEIPSMNFEERKEKAFIFNSGLKEYRIICHYWRLKKGVL